MKKTTLTMLATAALALTGCTVEEDPAPVSAPPAQQAGDGGERPDRVLPGDIGSAENPRGMTPEIEREAEVFIRQFVLLPDREQREFCDLVYEVGDTMAFYVYEDSFGPSVMTEWQFGIMIDSACDEVGY